MTPFPSGLDTVAISGSADLHVAWTGTAPRAVRPWTLASTTRSFPSWTFEYMGGETQRSPM